MVTLTNKLWWCCLAFMMVFSAAPRVALSDELCEYTALETAFRDYVHGIDQSRVEQIQQLLNDSGYGPVEIDGVLGLNTRLALQKVCQEFAVPESDDNAAAIVERLETGAIVMQAAPEWHKTIASETFRKAADEQVALRETLATGTAEEIITLLNKFTAASVAPSQEQPAAPEPEKLPLCTQPPIQLPADGVTVHYRWLGEKQPEESPEEKKEKCIQPENKLNPDLVAVLEVIKGVAYPSRKLFLQAVENVIEGNPVDGKKIDYQPDQLLVQARNEAAAPPAPLQVKGDGCGCSREFDTVVYGFFPSWMAQKELVSQIDFSLFKRIGFYALTLDHTGAIGNPLQWSDDLGSATFINTAHKHRVAVDLTLHASQWRDWNDAAINNAVNSTMTSIMHTFTDRDAPLSTYLPAMMKNGSSAQADGVTLYFDDYTVPGAGREKIVTFVTRLSKRIEATGRKIALNIMLGIDTTAMANQPVFKDLEAILLKSEEGPARVDNVLVFLQEPTSKAKKSIRIKIEDEFRGAHRKEVLRKIVPILSPAGHERDPRGPFSQFTDDLIYLQDNFAGAGFWPLPLPGDEGFGMISEKLIKLYTSATPSNQFGSMVSDFAPQLCQFVCPNRWLFRIGFDLLMAVLLIYALAAFWFSRPRELFKQYMPYFIAIIAVTVVIALLSLICDPFWQERADEVLVGIIVAGIAYATWRYVSRVKQLPLP